MWLGIYLLEVPPIEEGHFKNGEVLWTGRSSKEWSTTPLKRVQGIVRGAAFYIFGVEIRIYYHSSLFFPCTMSVNFVLFFTAYHYSRPCSRLCPLHSLRLQALSFNSISSSSSGRQENAINPITVGRLPARPADGGARRLL